MDKKDYIMKILDSIADESEIAFGLKTVVEHAEINDHTLDALVKIFGVILQESKALGKSEKHQKAYSALKELQSKEQAARQKEKEEANNLLEEI